MKNRNPNVVLLMKEKININKFEDNMKNIWNYECKFEVSKQTNYMNYVFQYNNIPFVLSVFDKAFPEDIKEDIKNSRYAGKSMEIYNCHTNFCMVAAIGNFDSDLNMLYACFTRVVMSLLLSNTDDECLVYDIRSQQSIDKKIYMKMLDNMKKGYEKNEDIFPIDWYVNYVIYRSEGKLNGVTIGFEPFNDYEIEIRNKEITDEEILKVMRYIALNVISRNDKIKSGELIPVPIHGAYKEAVVKKDKSKVLNKEILEVIF